MKNHFLLLIFCYACCQHLGAQSLFSIGANYSVLSYEQGFSFWGKQKLGNFKLTPNIGYGYRIQLNDKWTYQPAILLGDLGGINAPQRPRTVFAVYAISLNQNIQYRPLRWLSLGLSPTLNYNIYAGITGKTFVADHEGTRYDEEKLSSWSRFPGHQLNRWVISLVPTISFHISERWIVDCFYRNDLTNVGYPWRILNYSLRGYGTGFNLRYQLERGKHSTRQ